MIISFDSHLENQDAQSKNYMLVMEYADAGTLKNYLKENNNLTWDDKHNLAYQLACAVLCLHNEKIVHRDLVIYLLYIQNKLIYFIFTI
jgi:serine/threonine protein kinase